MIVQLSLHAVFDSVCRRLFTVAVQVSSGIAIQGVFTVLPVLQLCAPGVLARLRE